jgi:hypothetical protein
MSKTITLLFLFFVCTISYSQNELKLYRTIYSTADSLKKSGHILDIDKQVFEEAKKLDEQHPSKYFETATVYLEKSKFNEASFLYFLGLMRYKYYNSANPDYQASNDIATFASLKKVLGEPTNMYLKTDITNFISIVKYATDYYKDNDFTFFPKSKSPEKYDVQLNLCLKLKNELENNKPKYTTLWDAEIKRMKVTLNKI